MIKILHVMVTMCVCSICLNGLDKIDVPGNILTFINDKNPDILCIQEYSESANIDLKIYRHKYIDGG
jgi:hypothetical protein